MPVRPTVTSAPLLGRRRAQCSRARDLLGTGHPLVHVTDDMRVMGEQSMAVVTLLAASLSAVLAGVSEARAFLAAAFAVQVAMTWRLVLRASARRDHVLDLIAEGREDLPLRSVARERRRLRDPGHRVRLARALDALRDEATTPLVRRSSRLPLYCRRVVATVAPELEATAQALRRRDASVRGVALSERLLSGYDSPLYADDADRLREQLRRIQFLLDAAGSQPVTERGTDPQR
jgi:hypothetical protein